MENLSSFVRRFCSSVACYSHPNKSTDQYSLKKHDDSRPQHMGVFGWVVYRKREHLFEVSSFKDLGDKAGVSDLANLVKPNYQWEKDGILFYVKPDSESEDYQKAVKALKAILALKT